MDKVKTGEMIRNARKAKNYTQDELGNLLGVTNKAVSRWEKGESFPDVGILENLAQVLDLKIQDLVIGDRQQIENAENSMEEALTELLRYSKMQLREKKKKILWIGVAAVVLLCTVLIGMAGLQSPGVIFGGLSGGVYYTMYGLTLMLVLYGWFIQKNEALYNAKPERMMGVISCVTLIWIIVMTYVVSISAFNGIMPFGMDPASVGPFIVTQLTLAFGINALMMVLEVYRWAKGYSELYGGYVLQLAAIYLPVLYGDYLRRLDAPDGYIGKLTFRTAVVLIWMFMALLFIRVAKKKRG